MPARKVYPKEMTKNCALPSCGKEIVVTVNSHLEMRKLAFCCDEHRIERRRLVMAGKIEKYHYKGNQNNEYAHRGNWPESFGLGPRKNIEDI